MIKYTGVLASITILHAPNSILVEVRKSGSTILTNAIPLGTVPVHVPYSPRVRSKSLAPPKRWPK